MSFANVGKVWTPTSFEDYLKGIKAPQWCTKICLHHTASPSLQMRPKGLLISHIENIRGYYMSLGWKRGPHLFTDEDQIFGMTPLTIKGIHAVSFNNDAIGIEVLGNYTIEENMSGRGLDCWNTTILAVRALTKWLNLDINDKTIVFHRDDPKTSKDCPGSKIKKTWVLGMLNDKTPLTAVTHNTIISEKQYLPVIKYVVDNKGYAYDVAVKMLTRGKNNLFYFGDDWLEGAKYDANLQATVAPIDELNQIKKAC